MTIPPYLQPGDTIGIVAPARKITPEELTFTVDYFTQQGFRVLFGKHLFNEEHQFSGSDAQRAHDLQVMLNNREVAAILCARGGYGTMRIIDSLDFLSFNLLPKWICGFSDITVLHSHIHTNCDIATLHSTMPISINGNESENLDSLLAALTGNKLHHELTTHLLNREGNCDGELIGGNLSILYALANSVSDLDTTKKILFIEDVDEYLYHIDRMLLQLKRSGKLKNLAGLVVGSFTKMHDNPTPFGKTVEEIICEHCEEFDFPLCFNFPAGHGSENVAIKLGVAHNLHVGESCILTEL